MIENVKLLGKSLAQLIKQQLEQLSINDLMVYSRNIPKVSKHIIKFGRTIKNNKLIVERMGRVQKDINAITSKHIQTVTTQLAATTGLKKEHIEEIARAGLIAAGSTVLANIGPSATSIFSSSPAGYLAVPYEEVVAQSAIGTSLEVGTSMFAGEEAIMVGGLAAEGLSMAALGPIGLSILGGIAINELADLMGIF